MGARDGGHGAAARVRSRSIPKVAQITTADAARFDPQSDPSWDFNYAAHRAAYLLYRPLRRFIAKHVVDKAHPRIRRLLALPTSEALGSALAADPRDRDAWALAMWLMAIEPGVQRRLWTRQELSTYRSFEEGRSWVKLGRQINFEVRVEVGTGQLNLTQSDWMLTHAAGTAMRALWAEARLLAAGMARAGDGSWDPEMLNQAVPLILNGRLGLSGAMSIRYEGVAISAVMQARPHGNKAARRRAIEQADAARLQSVRALCKGPCLRFSFEHGWRAVESSEPTKLAAPLDIRKMRLFAPGRPHFYCFPTDKGLWCARLKDRPLEVVEDERWKAIDTLRHAGSRYLKMFGQMFVPPVVSTGIAGGSSA